MGEASRSECVAGMDMLNDMFQRQARRLESQLYQRAQDQRTIEMTQRQAQYAMAQVQQLQQHHHEQVSRVQHSTKSLHRLHDQMRESQIHHELVLTTCEALQLDVSTLGKALATESPQTFERMRLHCADCPPVEQLRLKADALEKALQETERSAMEQVDVTPTTSKAMRSSTSMSLGTQAVGGNDALDERSSNPLHDLSVVADYASKARLSQALMGSPLSNATRSLPTEKTMNSDGAMRRAAAWHGGTNEAD